MHACSHYFLNGKKEHESTKEGIIVQTYASAGIDYFPYFSHIHKYQGPKLGIFIESYVL